MSAIANASIFRSKTSVAKLRPLAVFYCLILIAEGVEVEAWLRLFARVLIQCSRPSNKWSSATLVRLGKNPTTNLHLGKEGGNPEEFLTKVGRK